jgi:hypothetical protein
MTTTQPEQIDVAKALIDGARAAFRSNKGWADKAVAQFRRQRRVPGLILRSLSDDGCAKAPENERHFVKTAAQNPALLAGSVVGRLGTK